MTDLEKPFKKYPELLKRVCKEVPENYLPPEGMNQIGAVPVIGYSEAGNFIDQINSIDFLEVLLLDSAQLDEDIFIVEDKHWVGGIRSKTLWLLPTASDNIKKLVQDELENLSEEGLVDYENITVLEYEAMWWFYKQDYLDDDSKLKVYYDKQEQGIDLTYDEICERDNAEAELLPYISESTFTKEFFEQSGQYDSDEGKQAIELMCI